MAIGLRAYFAFVPPPEATPWNNLWQNLSAELNGWKIKDRNAQPLQGQVTAYLNSSASMMHSFATKKWHLYWPVCCLLETGHGLLPLGGAHTPDTCWIVNGWTTGSERQYAVPFTYKNTEFQRAEFGVAQRMDPLKESILAPRRGQSYDLRPKEPHKSSVPSSMSKNTASTYAKSNFHSAIQQPHDFETLRKQPAFSQILNGLSTLGL